MDVFVILSKLLFRGNYSCPMFFSAQGQPLVFVLRLSRKIICSILCQLLV